MASLIKKERCLIPHILEAYSNREIIKNAEDLPYAAPRKSNHPHSLKTVWNVSFERLEPDQRKLVNLLDVPGPGTEFPLNLLVNGGCGLANFLHLHSSTTPRKFK